MNSETVAPLSDSSDLSDQSDRSDQSDQSDQANIAKPASVSAHTAIFAGGNFISLILRLAGGLVTARFCDPSVLGLFNGLGLVLGYVVFLQLGVLNGLNRELPYYIGGGDVQRARSLAATAQAWALTVGGVVAGSLLLFGCFQLAKGRPDLAAGWATYAVTGFLLFYVQQYLQITYRTGGDFSRLAVFNVIQSGLALLLICLVWLWGYYGLCLRALILGLLNLLLLWWWRPLPIRPHWRKDELRHLLRIGAPIFAAGQLYGWWVVLDGTLVVRLAGTTALGLYQLAVMAGQGMEVLPLALSSICYPRLAAEFGRSGSLREMLALLRNPVAVTFTVMLPLVALAWFALPPVVHALLPKYVEGIAAAQWSLCSAALMALGPVCDVFSVIRRLDLYFAAIAVGITAYCLALYLLAGSGAGVTLKAFPQAMLAGRLCYLVFSYLAVFLLATGESRQGEETA